MNERWRQHFSWSKTRQARWDECKRAYYYHYIAVYGGCLDAPFSELKRLARLDRFSHWQGRLIHQAINTQIARFSAGLELEPQAAKSYLLREVAHVQSNPRAVLAEAENGVALEAERFEAFKQNGLKQLDHFFNKVWPRYQNLTYLEHEKLGHFSMDGLRILVKTDLVVKEPKGSLLIADWKTGDEPQDPDESLQLGAYILWATHKYQVLPDQVWAELVYLQAAEIRPTQRSQEQLDEIREHIRAKAREMWAVKSLADLPATPEESKCKECSFATCCPEGKNFLKRRELTLFSSQKQSQAQNHR